MSSMSLLQRRDRPQRAALPGKVPVATQFVAVKIVPLEHEPQGPPGESPGDVAIRDSDADLVGPVARVEMRRSVIAKLNRDANSVEPRDLRHGRAFPAPTVSDPSATYLALPTPS